MYEKKKEDLGCFRMKIAQEQETRLAYPVTNKSGNLDNQCDYHKSRAENTKQSK